MKVSKQGIIGAKQIKPHESPDVSTKQVKSQSTPVNALDQLDRTAVTQLSERSAVSTPVAASKGMRTVDVRAAVEDSAHWAGFSANPEKLAALLRTEILEVQEFVSGLKDAFSFFGGARVRPEDEHFSEGKVWGEAVLLTNVAAKVPEVVAVAENSGVFSEEAVEAARAVALGCAVGSNGAEKVNVQLLGQNGGTDAASLKNALIEACCEETKAEDMALLMTLTRTGAGPGMMEAVPIGYLDARQKLMRLMPDVGVSMTDELVTQGSRIELPFEQKPNPYIEKMREFAHFLPRRLALTEQANGFVVFPGGVGTLNELFEVVRYGRPTVLCSTEFYGGMLNELTKAWKERDLVDPEIFKNLKVVDGPEEGLPHLLERAKASPPASEPSLERAEQLASDLQRGLETLSELPSAVTFIGGRRLKDTDREIPVARKIAEKLAKSGVPLRSGAAGAVMNAVSEGAAAGRPDSKIQGILLAEEGDSFDDLDDRVEKLEVVHSSAAHKVLTYENTDAIVALPGGVGTFDEIFELVTLMQCEKIPMRPLVLVGSEFWKPFLDEMARVMLDKDSDLPEDQRLKTISDEDMDMFHIVDDAADAARIIRLHRAGLTPKKKPHPPV
ncbi:MAG: LOG family protein [Myxococcota bacterium]|nr:LOG family protein [Myxococcota bacterium]